MFNIISIKISMTYTTEIGKQILKLLEKERLQIAKTILSKKSKAGGVTIPNFKLYYIPIKRVWYSHKNRYKDQGNRRPRYESLQLHPPDF
jgi:hypothetical protein